MSNLILLCPICRSALAVEEERSTCTDCGCSFPGVFGISDLRTFDPPYASREEDLVRAQELAARADSMSYAELLSYAYEQLRPEIGQDDRECYVSGRLSRANLNQEVWRLREKLIEECGIVVPRDGVGVDLGCGQGGFLATLATQVAHVIGVDIVMEELVLAQKFLVERGVSNVTMICTGGEKLPLPAASADLVNATNVIEHVRDPVAFIREAYRILVPGGVLCFDSPNRWDLIYPEPHVGVRWVGLWPRPLQEPYVRLVSGKEYKAKRLLSLPELLRVLRKAIPEANFRVFYWPRWNAKAGPRTFAGRWLRGFPRLLRVFDHFWSFFVGTYEVVAWKPWDGVKGIQEVSPMPIR